MIYQNLYMIIYNIFFCQLSYFIFRYKKSIKYDFKYIKWYIFSYNITTKHIVDKVESYDYNNKIK